MTITTFTIDSIVYTSYATVAEADAYLNIDVTREATWEALVSEDKEKKLIMATRRLDLLDWNGSKTGGEGTQEAAWPRTGVTYPDGTSVSTTEVPIEVQNATILLAGTIALTPATSNAGTTGSNRKRLKAGSAEIEFFSPTDGVPLQDQTAFNLISIFLGGSDALNSASGTGLESFTCPPDRDRFGLNKGFA